MLALFDIKVDQHGDNWVVMEYVPGESLEDVLARYPEGLPIPEALAWFRGIAAGVGYLHDRGIVHRDLKPGNIFNDDGQLKIGDYGLSKFISASRRSGQTESVGTVHYMAPEIANGRYGKEIDIYALGVILYELLTGRVPFEGESVGEVLMKHLTAQPDVGLVPAPYRAVVAHLLEKDPQKRIHSVAELLAALPASSAAPATASSTALPPRPRVEPLLAETTLLVEGPVPPVPPPPRPPHAPRGLPPLPRSRQSVARQAGRAMGKVEAWWSPLPTVTKILVIFGGACLVGLWNYRVPHILGAGTGGDAHWVTIVFWVVIGTAIVSVVRQNKARKAWRSGLLSNSALADPSSAGAPPPFSTPQSSAPIAQPLRAAAHYHRASRRSRRKSASRRVLAIKSPRERVTELVSSLLLAATVAAASALLILIVQRQAMPSQVYVWLALTSTLGAWGILLPAKLWEGRHGDHVLRRFVGLGVGLTCGLGAWALGQWLLIDLTNNVNLPHLPITTQGTHNVEGQPELLGYLAYFGFLFLLIRWWHQTDPLRKGRLSVWTAAGAVFWAYVLNLLWAFPQPWGMMTAATISVAVQLASPWVDPEQRTLDPIPASSAAA